MTTELPQDKKHDWSVPKIITGPCAAIFAKAGKQVIEREKQNKAKNPQGQREIPPPIKPDDQFNEKDGFIF